MEERGQSILNWLGDAAVNYAPQLVGAIATLIIGFWIIGRITKVAKTALSKRKVDKSIHTFFTSIVSIGLKILLILAVSNMVGIATTSFIAILGAMAFAVGMALQGSLGHFASGVMLLISRPYHVGDLVELGGGSVGHVVEIQIFNTVLKTLNNKRIIIPNGIVTSNIITNISGQGTIGVELVFGIGYDDNIDDARKIILSVGKSCPHVIDTPSQDVSVSELGDNSVNLITRPFCNSAQYWPTFFYMQEHVKKEFDKAGINIPYPQMDVHMSSS